MEIILLALKAWLQALAEAQTSQGKWPRGQNWGFYILVAHLNPGLGLTSFPASSIDSHSPKSRACANIFRELEELYGGSVSFQPEKSQSQLNGGCLLGPLAYQELFSPGSQEVSPFLGLCWPLQVRGGTSACAHQYNAPVSLTWPYCAEEPEPACSMLHGGNQPVRSASGANRSFSTTIGEYFVNVASPSFYRLRTILWSPKTLLEAT